MLKRLIWNVVETTLFYIAGHLCPCMKTPKPIFIYFQPFFIHRTQSTTSKPPKSRGRPPFLRPIAKFTDIKISALENIGKKKQNKQNNNAPVDDTDKDKPESKKCLLDIS